MAPYSLLLLLLAKILLIFAAKEYDTYFHLFSKVHRDKPISIGFTNTQKWSQEKSFETCPIKILAHGYAERWNMDWRWDWVKAMKDEFLNETIKPDYCIIAVDWEKGAREVNFITAVDNADTAGQHLARFIQNNGISVKRLHCIGFSLGAHLCAFASNHMYLMTKKKEKFDRITGLDPSGPLLRKASIDKRLSEDDADFVDCIHTSRTFGLQEKSGHMDFFPDGGDSEAKGCEKLIKIEDEEAENAARRRIKRFFFNKKPDEEDDDDDEPKKNFIEKLRDGIGQLKPLKKVFLNIHGYIGCNHLRSPHFFISSIKTCTFRAKLCSSWANYLSNSCSDPIDNDKTYPRMGLYADQSDPIYRHGNGSFYLKTTGKEPYCSPKTQSSPNSKAKKSLLSKMKKKISKIGSKRSG